MNDFNIFDQSLNAIILTTFFRIQNKQNHKHKIIPNKDQFKISKMIKRSSSLMTFHLVDKPSDQKYELIRQAIKNSQSSISHYKITHNQHSFISNSNTFTEIANGNNLEQIIKNSQLPNDAKFLQRDQEQYRIAQKIDKKRFKQLYRIQTRYEQMPIKEQFKQQLMRNNSSQKIVYKFGKIPFRNQNSIQIRQNNSKRKTSKVEISHQNKFNFKQKRQNITNMKPREDKYNAFSAIDQFVNKAIRGNFQFACGKNELVAADQKQLIIDI